MTMAEVGLYRIAVFAGLLVVPAITMSAADPTEVGFEQRIRPLLKTHCDQCHSGEVKEGQLSLDSLKAAVDDAAVRTVWWKVLKNLRAGVMPPEGHPRPSPQEVEVISDGIKFDIFGINPQDPDPGRSTVKRLNRREYDNTIDDLLGIKFDAALVFPPDDSGFGFDNVGDALSISPLLMEKYVRAAQMAVDQAVPRVTWIVPQQEFFGRDFRDERDQADGGRLSGKKAAIVRRLLKVEDDGTYDLHIDTKLHGTFDFDPSRYTIVLKIDGQERSRQVYGWDENKLIRRQLTEVWTAGDHELAFELIPVVASDETTDQPLVAIDRGATDLWFEVSSVRVEGPRGTQKRSHPRNYAKFFPRDEPPASMSERRHYAAEILRSFATRAFRGPVEPATIDRLVNLAEGVYGQPEKTFEAGIAQALVAVLASPRFLFRLESAQTPSQAGRSVAIDEWALASRLSYFFWSTMPDEELFRLAAAGELRRQMPQQVKRLMADRKADEFVRNFVGQWLRTRDVTQVTVDPIAVMGYQEEYEKLREQFRNRRRQPFGRQLSPEDEALRKRFGEFRAISDRFNDDMKRSMRRETEMCVEYIVQEDRSLLDLLDCDYTFVNEKLAELYGIPNVRGNELRRVTIPEGNPRGGILTHASMLLVTSNPTRTSPVKRGLFVLENILGTPAPPAPAGVPDLEESAKKFAGREPPLRELLAAHRESALCASCHSRMDPLGIALENFNALGMWRDREKDQKIDASGKLITGETFQDVRDLKRILRERHATDFYRCVTEKMLTYALGRGLEATDEHTIDLIVRRLIDSNGKFSDLIQGVVDSTPFQKQRHPERVTSASAGTDTAPASQGTGHE